MTDRDNITLPREVARLALSYIEWYIENEDGGRFVQVREAAEALRTALAAPVQPRCDGNHSGPRCDDPECWNDATAPRAHLAAEQPKPEPVAWQERHFFPKVGEWTHWYDCRPRMADYPREQIEQNGVRYQWRPLYAAPPDAPTVKESLTHPGYVIGSHWLETAYSRICAGEAEADVLRDCGWERVDDIEALRRDAERYRYLRSRDPKEVFNKSGKAAGVWIDWEDDLSGLQLLTGDDADAAIDAAMGDKT